MKKSSFRLVRAGVLLIAGCVGFFNAAAQTRPADTLPPYRNVAAATQYLSLLSQKGLVGQRYRLEWAMPVQAPVALLDTLAGGLRPFGIHPQGPATLQLRNADSAVYHLMPVVQPYLGQVPPLYKGSFIADFAADLQSAYHPYAPLAATALAQAAGVLPAAVTLIYLPQQRGLGTAGQTWGNQLYFLQRTPALTSQDTSTAWVTTTRLLQLLQQDNQNRVDAAAYVQCRLIDMLLGITNRDVWGWRWLAQPGANSTTIYKPFPIGYAGAFPLYEGKIVGIAKIVAPIKHLVSFEQTLPNPQQLNEKAVRLDRRLTAALNEQAWINAAAHLRATLSDKVIQNSLRRIPDAVRNLSGAGIEAKLKSRRDGLEDYAQKYYRLLAAQVDVPGTEQAEHIQITAQDSGSINISMYDIGAGGKPEATPFFNRTFQPAATKEINLYGIGGADVFEATGKLAKNIKLRIVGGPQPDSLRNRSTGRKLLVYDGGENSYTRNRDSRFHLRGNTDVHRYDLEAFDFDKKGLSPIVFYNNNDRLYAGISYNYIKRGWRKEPFAQRQKAYLNYSILQGGVSAGYEGEFRNIIGRWSGLAAVEFDAVRWNNFFGIGNETPAQVLNNDYHRVRTEIFGADAGLVRPLGRHHSVGVSGRFQTVHIRTDKDRVAAKLLAPADPLLYRTSQFAGAKITYAYAAINDPLLPSKGLLVNASGGYTKNIKTPGKEVMNYSMSAQFYVPFTHKLVWTSAGGLQAVTGNPEFYQLASIGGTATLRGYRRERFWGKTAFYNQNELQYLMPLRSYWFNGTVGLLALFDAGRVWQPGEVSDKLHTGYGAGLLVSPFRKLVASLSYARSEERGLFHIGLKGGL